MGNALTQQLVSQLYPQLGRELGLQGNQPPPPKKTQGRKHPQDAACLCSWCPGMGELQLMLMLLAPLLLLPDRRAVTR